MKPEKVRELDTKELEGQASEMTEQLFHLRFKIGMGQTDGLKKYRALKKDRARTLTILREREAAAQKEGNQQAMAEQTPQSHKNEKVGQVVSTRMRKTIVVEVSRRVPHRLYKKILTRRKKFYAHDEQETARVGDTVRIVESRPLSRLKRWRLAEVVRRAALVGVEDTVTAEAEAKLED